MNLSIWQKEASFLNFKVLIIINFKTFLSQSVFKAQKIHDIRHLLVEKDSNSDVKWRCIKSKKNLLYINYESKFVIINFYAKPKSAILIVGLLLNFFVI